MHLGWPAGGGAKSFYQTELMLSWIVEVVLVKPMDFVPMAEIVGMVGSTSMMETPKC